MKKIKTPVVTGYKVTNKNMQCLSYQFELGKIFTVSGEIIPCKNGFHYCSELIHCFGYYSFDSKNRVFEIVDHGTTKTEGNKSCTSAIEFVRELSWLEVLKLVNTGAGNSGLGNAGNYNAGNYNAGNDNAGYSNAGNYNAGNRNAGYSNAGNDNAGAFNNLQANYVMFNKPSNWTYEDFTSSTAYRYLSQIDTTLWIPAHAMSDKEKSDYPYYVTTGGYVKNLPYKEAFTNAWNNWSDSVKQSFKDLPNFDAEVFEDITGVKI